MYYNVYQLIGDFMNKNNKQLTIYFSPTKYELLNKLALEKTRSISNLINILITEESLKNKLKNDVYIGG